MVPDVGGHVLGVELDLVDMRCETDVEESLQVGRFELRRADRTDFTASKQVIMVLGIGGGGFIY